MLLKFVLISLLRWIQLACPRLSVDWGAKLPIPVITAFEAELVFGDPSMQKRFLSGEEESYAMDNWAANGNVWSNYYRDKEKR